MGSRYGADHGEPDYDKFRTGLRYIDVRNMIDRKRYRRRGTVLGTWHQIKIEMYQQATGLMLNDRTRRGLRVAD